MRLTYREVPLIFVGSILFGILCAGIAIWSYNLLGIPRIFWAVEAVVSFLLALHVPMHANRKLFTATCILFNIALVVGTIILLATSGWFEAIVEAIFFFRLSQSLTYALNSEEI